MAETSPRHENPFTYASLSRGPEGHDWTLEGTTASPLWILPVVGLVTVLVLALGRAGAMHPLGAMLIGISGAVLIGVHHTLRVRLVSRPEQIAVTWYAAGFVVRQVDLRRSQIQGFGLDRPRFGRWPIHAACEGGLGEVPIFVAASRQDAEALVQLLDTTPDIPTPEAP